MKELHVCHICKRIVGLAHDTLRSTMQTNRGKCVLHVQRNTPQTEIYRENKTKKKVIYSQ